MTFSPLSAWLKVETIHSDNTSSSNPIIVARFTAEFFVKPAIRDLGGKRKQLEEIEQDSKSLENTSMHDACYYFH